ncbi:MAG: type II toxin-antitoxin system HicB family antitoxin [Fretibacterium sp.]|nr:type II toxin-antitoxin system HicB family antitoxin [Fretibacterium sp.]
MKFTACYTKIEAGYMGQLLEWPEVITEGATLDECRKMLIDAAQEMADVYCDDGLTVPQPSILLEPLLLPQRETALAHVG